MLLFTYLNGFTQRVTSGSIESQTLGWTIQFGGITVTIDNNPLVLIADDLTEHISYYKKQLLERYDISTVSATTLEQLDEVFDKFFINVDVVILDGCMPGDTLNTIDFIRHARERGFTKPIIAASSSFEYRMAMIQAGCDYETEKESAPELASWILAHAR